MKHWTKLAWFALHCILSDLSAILPGPPFFSQVPVHFIPYFVSSHLISIDRFTFLLSLPLAVVCPSLSHHPVIPCGQFFVFFFPYVTLLFFSTFLSNCSLWAKPTTTNSQPSFTRILPGDPPSAASSATLDQATSVTLHDIVRLVSHFYLKISFPILPRDCAWVYLRHFIVLIANLEPPLSRSIPVTAPATASHTQLFIRPVVNFELGSPRVTNDLSK
ncbi:SUMO-conjugating enzyme ubc9 [Fusarium oxysporum f. sp. albedinis]|nr:SUMO-conjugating enzyme ubc9 [Fusarium oxysporum f. sp. albedinis]